MSELRTLAGFRLLRSEPTQTCVHPAAGAHGKCKYDLARSRGVGNGQIDPVEMTAHPRRIHVHQRNVQLSPDSAHRLAGRHEATRLQYAFQAVAARRVPRRRMLVLAVDPDQGALAECLNGLAT